MEIQRDNTKNASACPDGSSNALSQIIKLVAMPVWIMAVLVIARFGAARLSRQPVSQDLGEVYSLNEKMKTSAPLTLGVVGAVLLPFCAAIGAIVALVKFCILIG